MSTRLNLWPWAFVLAVVSTTALMQQLDSQASDHETEALAAMERRLWIEAVAHCHRSFGPQTAPEYDEHDRLVCVGKRGERIAAISAAYMKGVGK